MKNRGLYASIKQRNNRYLKLLLSREIAYETGFYSLSKQLADATIQAISVTSYQLPSISPRNMIKYAFLHISEDLLYQKTFLLLSKVEERRVFP